MNTADQGPPTSGRGFAGGVSFLVAYGLLRVITAAGLAIDAYVTADLAPTYDPISKSISQGDLFRIEAGLASLAALLVLVFAWRVTWAFAFLTAGGGLALLLIYRYVNVGSLGPVPNMYEPVWFSEKTTSAIAQGVAAVTALAGFTLAFMRRREVRRSRSSRPSP